MCSTQAIARARAGEGPTFVECVTYRMAPHSTSDDPSRYRSQRRGRGVGPQDPLDRMRAISASAGALELPKTKLVSSEETSKQIATAIDEVEALGPPPRDSLFDDVYAELPWHLSEQRG